MILERTDRNDKADALKREIVEDRSRLESTFIKRNIQKVFQGQASISLKGGVYSI